MKKTIAFGLGSLIVAGLGLVHLINSSWKNKSDEDLYTERQKALDDGYDRHSSLVKAYDNEINRRSDEQYKKETPIPRESVYREHAGLLKFDK